MGRHNEGLDEDGGDAIAFGPVLGQVPVDDGEYVRAEVGNLNPWQDKEPRVFDHKEEVLLSQLGRPTGKAVERG